MSETRQIFKTLPHQAAAAEAVAACFEGQPHDPGLAYRIDPGTEASAQTTMFETGTRNAKVLLKDDELLKNIRDVQAKAMLPPSDGLTRTDAAPINLDIEMETGTGKTYVYIDTMYRLHQAYGWSKFIVVVPSVAIREGVYKTFEDTEAHFQERYGHKVRRFIYDSGKLEKLTAFSEENGLHCMIINTQAFTADVDAGRKADEGKKAGAGRIIFDTPDKFGSRRPIDVIAANHPILILDEPQRMEGAKTKKALGLFQAPLALRYSATHRTKHDLVHRLDALDAYNAKLVKRIMVRGVTTKGMGGTSGYLVLDDIRVSTTKPPEARLHMEVARTGGEPKREYKIVRKGDDLHALSKGLDQYRDHTIANIDAAKGELSFTSREPITKGEIVGTDDMSAVRRVQIRETIKAHFERERTLHAQGIKVLSLFFIDEVAKYRIYDENGQKPGPYALMFEEEYRNAVDELKELDESDADWHAYVKRDEPSRVHEGYFSIDKKGNLKDPDVHGRGEEKGEAKDVDAYDLILKRKGELLSLDQPVRFIFSHSALREGWDNPNVFQICTLKHSDSEVGKRQEVGRGLRIAVDKHGSRTDGTNVHDINILTVVASESYEDFAKALQDEMKIALAGRPREASEEYFTGKTVQHDGQSITIDQAMARNLEFWLIQNGYVDINKQIQPAYRAAKDAGTLAPLPAALAPYEASMLALVDTVFDPSALDALTGNGRNTVTPRLRRENFDKKAFQDLWDRINQKAVYFTDFETDALVENAIRRLDRDLSVPQQRVVVTGGAQRQSLNVEDVRRNSGFSEDQVSFEHREERIQSTVRYDVVGRLAAETRLTRGTVGAILKGMKPTTFAKFGQNPEAFIKRSAELVRAEKVRLAVEKLRYHRTDQTHDAAIFTTDQPTVEASRTLKSEKSVFDHVVTDSDGELSFAGKLEGAREVTVYAKLPRGFAIPTPGGPYNPDWAIALEKDGMKEIYFVAETKGSLLEEALRINERQKIDCAIRFFDDTVKGVRYQQIDGYDALMDAIA